MKKSIWATVWNGLAAAALLAGSILWLRVPAAGWQESTAVCGAILGIAGIFCLMAERLAVRRQQEREQKAYHTELEALTQAHKETLQKQEAEQRQEIESFRSTLSHSLRMPVAIIQGYAELLSGDMVKDPQDQKVYLEKIIQRSQYMTEVMSRQFAAEESMTSQQLNYTEFDLLELIRQAGNDMQSVATEKSVTIQVLSTENTLPVEADAYLLSRVIFNLIENATKYMGRPGVVTIRAQREDEQVTVDIRDDGMGLTAQETARVFEACFRGSEHMNISGQGYGLHLVKQTVEAHGGSVRAESSPGYGMRVTLQFPAHPAVNSESL